MQQGHYSPSDLHWLVEHGDGVPLLELDPGGGISWSIDNGQEPAGAGLGDLKNKYYKQVAAPKGTYKISRALLQRSDKGMLFLEILVGAKVVHQESAAAAATTHTISLNTALVSILEIRLVTSLTVLQEGVDFTVNYVTGVITFPIALPEAAVIRYLASSRKLKNYLVNGGFEDALTNIWVAEATAVLARNSANAYVEGYALGVTPSVTNDGVRYSIGMKLQPGRTYRLRGRAKAAAAEVLAAYFNDGSSDVAMTVVSGATLSTSYAIFEFTFVATKSVIPSILIKDTKASPALFYLDELMLIEDTTGNNPTLVAADGMSAGQSVAPMTFNLIGRRILDGVVAYKLMQCNVDKLDYKSGNKYAEDISGNFLGMFTE